VLQHDLEESIGYWTFMVSRAFERALNEELAPHGITHRQCQVLGWLALERELSPSELAERMNVEPPTLVRILDRMERNGWIERQTSTTDRRRKLVRPVSRARPVWEKVLACARRVRDRATQGIALGDLETTLRVLAAARDNLLVNTLVGEPAS
jgi:MarR family transcriptional regulator, transcriptional regulator for hemolysin